MCTAQPRPLSPTSGPTRPHLTANCLPLPRSTMGTSSILITVFSVIRRLLADLSNPSRICGKVVGAGGCFALLTHPVHRLVLAKPAQLEMTDLKNRFSNFACESIGHQQWPADILAEEFQS